MLSNIRKWISHPIFEGDDEKTLSATLLNLILWVFIFAASAYGLFAPIEAELIEKRAAIIIPFLVVLLILKELTNRGYIRLMGNLIVITLWLVFTSAMLLGADYQNPAFMGYLIIVICAGLILSWRSAIGWGVFSILTSGTILRLGQIGVLPLTKSTTPTFAFWAAQSAYIFTSTILLGMALQKIDEARTNAKRELGERKHAEAEREKVIKELESKNAELERFTYTVSHDLKSPLITIGGFVGLLEEDAHSGNTEKINKDLERIREAKDKMYRLLNELLELSRIGRLINAPTDIPFAQIVDEALSLTKGRVMAGNVQVDVSNDLPIVLRPSTVGGGYAKPN